MSILQTPHVSLNKSGLESSRKPDETNPERTINAIKRSPYAGDEQLHMALQSGVRLGKSQLTKTLQQGRQTSIKP